MKITYDHEADAVYMCINESNVDVVDTQGEWPYHVDLSEDGKIVGIEVMDARTVFNKDYLSSLIGN